MFTKVKSVRQAADLLASKPYGMIQASAGETNFIQIRPFPKMVSVAEAMWIGGWVHRKVQRDRVQVFYNQPSRHKKFFVAKYAVSELGTTLATMRASFRTFMEIARLKRADAVLCEVISRRVTDRFMSYWGFEPHNRQARGRHYIRRFYGEYPDYTDWIADLQQETAAQPIVTALPGCSTTDTPART